MSRKWVLWTISTVLVLSYVASYIYWQFNLPSSMSMIEVYQSTSIIAFPNFFWTILNSIFIFLALKKINALLQHNESLNESKAMICIHFVVFFLWSFLEIMVRLWQLIFMLDLYTDISF
jgi:hypothetical protein